MWLDIIIVSSVAAGLAHRRGCEEASRNRKHLLAQQIGPAWQPLGLWEGPTSKHRLIPHLVQDAPSLRGGPI